MLAHVFSLLALATAAFSSASASSDLTTRCPGSTTVLSLQYPNGTVTSTFSVIPVDSTLLVSYTPDACAYGPSYVAVGLATSAPTVTDSWKVWDGSLYAGPALVRLGGAQGTHHGQLYLSGQDLTHGQQYCEPLRVCWCSGLTRTCAGIAVAAYLEDAGEATGWSLKPVYWVVCAKVLLLANTTLTSYTAV
jgi:hypothetical protein